MATGVGGPFGAMLLASGISTEAAAIASAIGSNQGIGTTTRSPAKLRQIIRGEQRVAGTIVYQSTTGNSDDQYNFVIVLATHPCEAIVNLYLDGRQVYWESSSYNQTVNGYNFGGNADNNTYIGPNGVHYNFGGAVFCAAFYGNQTSAPTVVNGDWVGPSVIDSPTQTYPGFCSALQANDPTWAPNSQGTPYLAGCTYVYLKLEYNTSLFPQFPEIKFTVMGKNDIYDPRTGETGYTTNWALHVADAITDPAWGLGDDTVNEAQLIAAANVCDEQIECAAGLTSWEPDTLYTVGESYSYGGNTYTVTSNYRSGSSFGSTDTSHTTQSSGTTQTEAQYALSWAYDTGTSPGDAINQMMQAVGRLSRIGGEWYIWPAYWQGPSFTFDENSLVDQVQWSFKRSPNDLVNRVTGTYIAPNYPYNIAGNLYDSNGYYNGQTQNNFPYAFQPTNYPMFACDELHGFGTGVDVYLQEDGGIPRPREVPQPTVLSIAQAQRLASIYLLRNRQQGTGTLPMTVAAYQLQPTDVFYFNMPSIGWTNKVLEVVKTTWKFAKPQGSDTAGFMVEVEVQETDSSVYAWDPAGEELTAYDVPAISGGVEQYTVQPPTGLAAVSNVSTALIQPNGIVTPRIELTWTAPTDPYVTNGGFIIVQMCAHGTGAWQTVMTVDGQTTQVFLSNVIAGDAYDVQLSAIRSSGAQSTWTELADIQVAAVLSAVTAPVIVAPAGTLTTSAEGTLAEILIADFTATVGTVSVSCVPSPSLLPSLQQGANYYVYYVDPNFAGGVITPIATQNEYDFLGLQGYYLIGSIVTAYETAVLYPAPPVVTLSQSATAPAGTSNAVVSSGTTVNTNGGLTAISPIWLTITWTWPTGYPTPSGFNVVVFTGSDPTATANYLAPITTVGASVLDYTFAVTPNSTLSDVNAAVEAIYG